MNESTITRRHAHAALPTRTLERVDVAAPQPYAAALFAFEGEAPFLVVNTLVATSLTAQDGVDRWAHEQLAQGETLALLDAAELRALA